MHRHAPWIRTSLVAALVVLALMVTMVGDAGAGAPSSDRTCRRDTPLQASVCGGGPTSSIAADHSGQARVREPQPIGTTGARRVVTAWRWRGERWHRTSRAAGTWTWVEPFADGWSWAWHADDGWLAMRTSSLEGVPAERSEADARTTVDLTGPWRSDGRFIRDRHGRAVFFHGVNVVWKRAPYAPPSTLDGTPADDSYFDGRDAAFLAHNGLNSVRLGVLFAGVQPRIDRYDDAYLARMARITDTLADHDVSVLVDFHQDMYNEAYRGEGFPDWARLDRGTRPTNCCGFPANSVMPSVMWAWDDLWDDRGRLWTHYRRAWQHTAARFASRDNVIGYDLINEPFPGSWWPVCSLPTGCEAFDTGKLQPFYEHVIAGIRTVDRRTPIWWEPHVMSVVGPDNHVGRRRPLRDPADNLVLSFHSYCALGGHVPGITLGNDPVCPVTRARTFRDQLAAASRNDSAAALTEFGATDDPADIGRTAALADRHMTSWHYWHYGAWGDPTGVPGEQGMFADDLDRPGSLKQAKADALVRTYPQAVAGTPLAFGFFPARADRLFALTYRVDPSIAKDTVVYVPVHRHYREGYVATLDGPATVTSPRDAHQLTIRATGPGVVRIVVRRR